MILFVENKSGAQVARAVVELTERRQAEFRFVYDDALPLWEKMKTIATKIYGAAEITADSKVRGEIKQLQEGGYGHYPVCVAKTQYSFSTDAQLRGAPSGHAVNIREVRLAAGAEFIVMVCGDIMTMPGLPKVPSSAHIDIDEKGRIVGLFQFGEPSRSRDRAHEHGPGPADGRPYISPAKRRTRAHAAQQITHHSCSRSF